MRIYDNCHEMHSEVTRDIHEMGTIVHPQTMQDKDIADNLAYRTLELSPCVFTVLDGGSDKDQWILDLEYNLPWCYAELKERLRSIEMKGINYGENPGTAWKLRAEVWKEFMHDGMFSYTYSQRFSRYVDGFVRTLPRIIQELNDHPDTRQAVLPVFDYEDLVNLGGGARVPCSLQYQFLIRDGRLNAIYTMRSTDFFTHFPYDIWMALTLQETIADKINRRVGQLTFFTGSLHIYAKDAKEGIF